jgi:transcriptional regulator with XRE-family HTH domain
MRVLEDWPSYVRRIAGGMTQAQIAAKVGSVSVSNVGRWLRGEHTQPGADSVIAFAKAFHRPIVEALTAAGYVSEGEVDTTRTPLTEYSTAELFAELQNRVNS